MDSLGALALATEPPAGDTMEVTTTARRERREKLRARAAARAAKQQVRSSRPAPASEPGVGAESESVPADMSGDAVASSETSPRGLPAAPASLPATAAADADCGSDSTAGADGGRPREAVQPQQQQQPEGPGSPLIAQTRSASARATRKAAAAAAPENASLLGSGASPRASSATLQAAKAALSPLAAARRSMRLPAWAELPVPVALLQDVGHFDRSSKSRRRQAEQQRPLVPVSLQSKAADCVTVPVRIVDSREDEGSSAGDARQHGSGEKNTGQEPAAPDAGPGVGRLIDGTMTRYIVGQAAAITALILVLLQVPAAATAVFGLRSDQIGTRVHLTAVFNAFVALQLFNLLCARRIHDQLDMFRGLLAAKPLLGIVAAICVVQAVLVQFGGDAFQTAPLLWRQWLGSVAVGSVSVAVSMLLRLASPKTTRRLCRRDNKARRGETTR